MNVNRASISKRASGRIFVVKAVRFFKASYEPGTCSVNVDSGNDVATFDLQRAVADGDIREIDRCAHPRLRALKFGTMTLDRANARFKILRLNYNVLAAPELSASQCASRYCTDTAQCKSAIDKQARFSEIALCLDGCKLLAERTLQTFNSFAGADRRWNDR